MNASNAGELQHERQALGARRVFSGRLETFLDQLAEGTTPNSGRFCSFCYNPLPEGFGRCDHCGQDAAERATLQSLPGEVLDMHLRKRKRESLIVNSFAYAGLALSLALFLAGVAAVYFWWDRNFWLLVLNLILLVVTSRVFPGVLGGLVGDEVGFRYAGKRLAEDWTEHVSRRHPGRQE